MSDYYRNLKLHSVKYGFGWRYDGDMSTHPIDNILQDIDYKIEQLKKERNLLLEAVEFCDHALSGIDLQEALDCRSTILYTRQELEKIGGE